MHLPTSEPIQQGNDQIPVSLDFLKDIFGEEIFWI
jgi:hypothetical protein